MASLIQLGTWFLLFHSVPWFSLVFWVLSVVIFRGSLLLQLGVSVLEGNIHPSSRVPVLGVPWVLSRPLVSGLCSLPSMVDAGLG